MKKHPLLSTFVLLVLGLQYGLGQNASYRSLCVEVVDRTTLDPLTGATVSVKGHPRHAALTDTADAGWTASRTETSCKWTTSATFDRKSV